MNDAAKVGVVITLIAALTSISVRWIMDSNVDVPQEVSETKTDRESELEKMLKEIESRVDKLTKELEERRRAMETLRVGEEFEAVVTAYTAGLESTGKRPGHPAYNITASGVKGGYGICAADSRYWPFGTGLYIEGLGACIVLDRGGAIKGRGRFDYMFGGDHATAVRLAREWGKRKVKVRVLWVPEDR